VASTLPACFPYLNTLRWNTVTATDPAASSKQPWRAGIDVKAYQLEPLRKAYYSRA